MSDKELLEKAARAAGIKIPESGPWGGVSEEWGVYSLNDDGSAFVHRWNPLENNGDAFELLHRCDLEIFHGENDLCEPIVTVVGEKPLYKSPTCDAYDIAGLRRAIVRAAAAMEDS